MGLARWRYRTKINRPVNDAAEVLADTIELSPADPYFRSVCMGCLNAAGATVFDFASDVARKADQKPLKALAQSLREQEVARKVLRVPTWTYLSQVIDDRWSARYHEAVDVGEAALGIESEAERRIARFGPLPDVNKTGEFARLMRFTMEGMAQAGTGSPVELKHPDVVLRWTVYYEAGWLLYQATLDARESTGPLSD